MPQLILLYFLALGTDFTTQHDLVSCSMFKKIFYSFLSFSQLEGQSELPNHYPSKNADFSLHFFNFELMGVLVHSEGNVD